MSREKLEDLLGKYDLEIRQVQVLQRPDGISWGGKDATHWVITLIYQGRGITFCYTQGSAHKNRPDKWDVLACILNTSSFDFATFEDWCNGLGYDSDSIKAHKTYETCVEQGKQVMFLLGKQFDKARDYANDM